MAGGFLFGICSACCAGEGGDCADCDLTCCLTIQGRDTCNGDTEVISADPLIVESWGQTGNTSTWQYLSDERDLFVEVAVGDCVDGAIDLDVTLTEAVPGNVGGAASSTRRWANAVAILGPDGCPTGVALGDLTETDGPAPTITLALAWICT